MRKRRGRRGFWWWSWLLLLVTLGGVAGGYFYGQKKWEEAPKDYQGLATVSFKVRPPFVPRSAEVPLPSSSVANSNELDVLQEAKSDQSLSILVTELDLSGKWEMGTDEAVNRLRQGLEFNFDKATDQLGVSLLLHDPGEAAEVANAIATNMATIVKEVDERKKKAAFELLKSELQPLEDLEVDARLSVEKALKDNGVTLQVAPGIPLDTYLNIQEVMSAKVEWDSSREDLIDRRREQQEYRAYWARPLGSTFVSQKAEVAPHFVGPPVKPVLMRWTTYGLTAGMVLGSLLMLACWKLFP